MAKKLYAIWLCVCLSICACAHADSLSVAERNALQGFNDTIDRMAEDFVEAYVSIAEPGDYLYSTLGHAAYHLKCSAFGLDYYYSMEGENTPDAVWRFLAGKLKMGMMCIPAKEYLAPYGVDNRGVHEWKLNLTPEQKQRLWQVLDQHVSEKMHLSYDYYHRCCAITIVNIMNEVVGRENIHYTEPWPDKFKRTPREFVRDALRGHDEWTQFFICILAGNEVDKNIPYERKFVIPMDVIEAWQTATINDRPVLTGEPVEMLPYGIRKKDTWCTPLLLSAILLLLSLGSLGSLRAKQQWIKASGRIVDYLVLGIVTMIGLFMTYLLFLSQLPCTEWNWLYIAFNPLPLLLWYWRRYWALPYAIVQILWIIAMIFAPHLLALWPHIILTAAFAVVLIKQRLMARTDK